MMFTKLNSVWHEFTTASRAIRQVQNRDQYAEATWLKLVTEELGYGHQSALLHKVPSIVPNSMLVKELSECTSDLGKKNKNPWR